MTTRTFLLAAMCLWTISSAQAQSLGLPASLAGIEPVIGPLAKRVHVILAGDTSDAQTGRSAETDIQNLEILFRQLIPVQRQLQIRTLRGHEVSKDNILRTIGASQPGPDDALVFIWTGRGGPNFTGRFFSLPSGDVLDRSVVVKAMQLRHPRLVVLLSAAWNEEADAALRRGQRPRYCFYPNVHDDSETIAPIAEELFLEPRGVVDINGASEAGLPTRTWEDASAFPRPLLDYLRAFSGLRVSWPSLVGAVGPLVQLTFEDIGPDGNQKGANGECDTEETLIVWSLPVDDQGPRLGVAVTDHHGDGVRVLEVLANYPAASAVCVNSGQRCVLEPNDVILSINGQPVRCIQDFDRAVKLSPQQITLAVRNWRDGQVGFLAVTLRY